MSAIGTQFHRWTVISEPRIVEGHTTVDVQCACGNLGVKRLAVLKFGTSKSCGCLRRELVAAKNKANAVDLLIGSEFGRLKTLESPMSLNGVRVVHCQCTCGVRRDIQLASLLSGSSRSCGCLRSEMVAAKNKTHGLSDNPLYNTWGNMKDRCTNPSNKRYHNYGGRGIKVCSEWIDSFEKFYLDVGEAPFSGASLDRKDNDGDYCKENVRWATQAQQMENTSRNKRYSYGGRMAMLKDISKAENLNLGTLYYRVNTMKLSIDEALNLPRYSRKRR